MGKIKALTFILFLLPCVQMFAQKNADTSSAEIRQQAIEMRDMLDRYLADKLKQPANNSNTKIADTSMANMMIQFNKKLEEHEKAINEIKAKISQLEELKGGNKSKDLSSLQSTNSKKFALPTEQPNEFTLILYFDFDSYELTQEQKNAIVKFTSNLNYTICNVHSYTDWFGTEKHNKYLALNRCEAVAKSIVNKNYKIRKGKFINCGSVDPVKINKSAYCRRVEIILK